MLNVISKVVESIMEQILEIIEITIHFAIIFCSVMQNGKSINNRGLMWLQAVLGHNLFVNIVRYSIGWIGLVALVHMIFVDRIKMLESRLVPLGSDIWIVLFIFGSQSHIHDERPFNGEFRVQSIIDGFGIAREQLRSFKNAADWVEIYLTENGKMDNFFHVVMLQSQRTIDAVIAAIGIEDTSRDQVWNVASSVQ
ncbi:MAG: hypothetical protein CMM93_07030 [Rickettsiales bacterium]|nr:hypothetical protein [Rickettsiales bacterium]